MGVSEIAQLRDSFCKSQQENKYFSEKMGSCHWTNRLKNDKLISDPSLWLSSVELVLVSLPLY